ncbi:MAG: hypothetical protein QOD34_37, partial [Mycobacterium sp.]|nr:hypothetical protein [Mycobacterium sp.]
VPADDVLPPVVFTSARRPWFADVVKPVD